MRTRGRERKCKTPAAMKLLFGPVVRGCAVTQKRTCRSWNRRRQTFANVRIFARTVRTQAAGPRALGFWFGGSRAGPGESLFWQVPKWCRCSRSRNHTLQKPWIRHSPNWLAVKITYGGFSFFRFKLLLPFLPLSLPLSLLPALHFSFPSSLPSSSSFVSDWAVYAKD